MIPCAAHSEMSECDDITPSSMSSVGHPKTPCSSGLRRVRECASHRQRQSQTTQRRSLNQSPNTLYVIVFPCSLLRPIEAPSFPPPLVRLTLFSGAHARTPVRFPCYNFYLFTLGFASSPCPTAYVHTPTVGTPSIPAAAFERCVEMCIRI